jgi:hypothetical protein
LARGIFLVVVIPGAAWVFAGRPRPGEGFVNLVLLAETAVIAGAVVVASLFRAYTAQRRTGMSVPGSFTAALRAAPQALKAKSEDQAKPSQ